MMDVRDWKSETGSVKRRWNTNGTKTVLEVMKVKWPDVCWMMAGQNVGALTRPLLLSCFFVIVWSSPGFTPPPPSSPTSTPYRKKSHEPVVLTSPPHYANCFPTEALVSMPPNKCLASVSWQNETFGAPQETSYPLVCDSFISEVCSHEPRPGFCSICLSPWEKNHWSAIW